MGFWKMNQRGVSTPSDEWMREELAAQKAGKKYHDASRLVADAAEIKTQFSKEDHRVHSAWLDWPWKLHRITGHELGSKVSWQLFNLKDDPMEQKNLREVHPDRVKKMQDGLEGWLDSVVDSLNGKDYP